MGQVKLQHRQCNRHTYTLSMYVQMCTEYTNLGGARDSHYVITPPTICITAWTQPPTLKHSATAGVNCLQYLGSIGQKQSHMNPDYFLSCKAQERKSY